MAEMQAISFEGVIQNRSKKPHAAEKRFENSKGEKQIITMMNHLKKSHLIYHN